MKEQLIQFIGQDLLIGMARTDLSEHDDLLGSGLLDSLSVLSLVLFIEREFGVDVPPEDVTVENFLSVATIEAYVRQRQP